LMMSVRLALIAPRPFLQSLWINPRAPWTAAAMHERCGLETPFTTIRQGAGRGYVSLAPSGVPGRLVPPAVRLETAPDLQRWHLIVDLRSVVQVALPLAGRREEELDAIAADAVVARE